ncbi:hypothetical protein AMTR_s00064p00093670 [Amborella trichopoda]|uniref:Uncharacterized protein n=1 Tax=Amborella trichopoda TaxID=13333 RepID=U5D2B6_AMBTC|nr:hypothetical protein AMTR_s00064p00093670 [Amborella trichopoda]
MDLVVDPEASVNPPGMHHGDIVDNPNSDDEVFFDPSLALVEADESIPLEVVPQLGPPLMPLSLAEGVEESIDPAEDVNKIEVEENVHLTRVEKMVGDMGMHCDVPIGILYEEVRARKLAHSTSVEAAQSKKNKEKMVPEITLVFSP